MGAGRYVWLAGTAVLAMAVSCAASASAQTPTEAQGNAIRQSCRADYQAHCAGVPPGSAALSCLQSHAANLSSHCRQALAAVGSGPAHETTQTATMPQVAPGMQWPHSMTVQGAAVTVYEPQAISWPDHATLTARAAVAITPAGSKSPILGTIEVSGTTTTDLDSRSVTFARPKLVATHFPMLDTGQALTLEAKIQQVLANMPARTLPLDTVLLSLKGSPAEAAPVTLDNSPPRIFYSARPASLVVFDGQPVLAPIGQTGLTYAVNTNWDVVYDSANGGAWYLLNNGVWLTAPAYSGPFRPAGRLPAAFQRIPNDQNFAGMRRNVPGRSIAAANVPAIFVSITPAEIIVTEGSPAFVRIAGTALEYAKNTDSALFRDTASKQYFYLVSGRWFSAPGLDGPWTFATSNLPTDFALIPPQSHVGSVLASVPGTAQAQVAALSAGIPRQGTLKRDTATVSVAYVGAPEFKPIPGTALQYAVNTNAQVIATGGRYYACYQGAWFVSASPTGPWVLADSVPPAIYTIPPSNPLYNVTYVRVDSYTPQAVTYSYTAGYLMGFITAGVLVYGTGYYYPPVVVPRAIPAYLPYPYSYAGGVYYNPATGAWARGGAIYGPYGAARAGAAYNPATGAYARGAAVYGPYGGAGAWSAYNPSTGTYAHGSAVWGPNGGTAHAGFYNPRYGVAGSTTQNANAYGRWGSSTVSGPNKTVNTASASNSRGAVGGFSSSTGAAGAGVHGAKGNNAGVVRGPGGNVYAGADGNAYKHTDSGWSKWNNGSWQPAQPQSSGTRGNGQYRQQGNTLSGTQDRMQGRWGQAGNGSFRQLDQDRFARQQGEWDQRGFGGRAGEFRGRRF